MFHRATFTVRILIVLGITLAVGCITYLRYQPPSPAPATSADFSAMRALEHAAFIYPNNTPHPRESAEHHRVIQRLTERLTEVGVPITIQRGTACSPFGPCAPFTNVAVHFSGQSKQRILVSAHTDSVPTGPGAGDDAHGVGLLVELAERLKSTPRNNPVTLLFTDGEEDGLFGAVGFLQSDPFAHEIAVCINVEARGNRGVSSMFRTSGANYDLIQAYAKSTTSPFTSSMHQVVFQLMPYYTDLSVWNMAEIPGYDFAFFDGAEAYHTPNDTLENLNLGSLQSQGQEVSSLLHTLIDTPLDRMNQADAHWFDWLGLTLVYWPATWTLWLSILLTMGFVGLLGVHQRRASLGWRTWVFGATIPPLWFIGCGLIGVVLTQLPMRPPLAWLSVAVTLTGAFAALGFAARTIPSRFIVLLTGLYSAVLALGASLTQPGLTHLMALPALACAGFECAAHITSPRVCRWLAGLVYLAVASVWLPVLEGVRVALGQPAVFVMAIGAGFVALHGVLIFDNRD